ncbi:MAG: hypothetical protein U5J83_02760 [Bryobacterales bacterium]|nr:hypothetical protein [Bryobacterales bacterium]
MRAPNARRRPIYPHPLIDRDQHDVHYAHAANPQRQQSHENRQYLKPDRDAVDDRAEFLTVHHPQGAFVVGVKALPLRDGIAHLRNRFFLKIEGGSAEHHSTLA